MRKLLSASGCLRLLVGAQVVWLALFAWTGTAQAQVPQMINYQGRISVAGTNYDGSGQFKFAMVNAGGSTTYWSNGVNAATCSLTRGLFFILLGDTNLPNMAALPASVFTNSDVWLRVWFAPQGSPLQLLAPDQRLAASGYSLMAAKAYDVAGTLADGRLSTNVALLNTNLVFSGSNRFVGAVTMTNSANVFSGNGSGITSVNADQLDGQHGAYYQNSGNLTGVLADARLSANVALLNTNLVFSGSNRFAGAVTMTNSANVFSGNGSGITSVNADQLDGQHGAFYQNASNLTSGTVSDARLSTNVALLSADQLFTGSNRFTGVSVMTNPANLFAGSFNGNASGLTNVAASGLTGTVSLARLPDALVTNNESGLNLSGTFSGNGAGVSNVDIRLSQSHDAISWSTNWGYFTPLATFSAFVAPKDILIADLNGDGRPDLATASFGSDKVLVHTNNGSAGFSQPIAGGTAVGGGPCGLAAADVNGDGSIDLICANQSGDSVTVLTNNGLGGMIAISSASVGDAPYSVSAGDFNGDSKVDLVTANYNANSLTVLTNVGGGFYATATNISLSTSPYHSIAVDVNGDTMADIVTFEGSGMTVLTNNGHGVFVNSAWLPTGIDCRRLAAEDINGDGKVDLLSLSYTADNASVYTNAGAGVFNLACTVGVGNAPRAFKVVDVNADGFKDLVVANFVNNMISVYRNNGALGFTLMGTQTTSSGPTALDCGDLNGDGHPDVAIANLNVNSETVMLNTPQYLATFTGFFEGDGGSLTNVNADLLDGAHGSYYLNAANLTGTLAVARLPAAAVTNNESGVTLSGTFSGNGSGLTNSIPDSRLSTNVALLDESQTFTGTNRFATIVRMGSESTGEAPSPSGLILRRINNSSTGSVVAVVRNAANTANITLERDATDGGFLIRYPATPGNITVTSMGMGDLEAVRNSHLEIANPGTAGTVQLYTDGNDVVYFQCAFGVSETAGQHFTQVTLSRYNNTSLRWVGTLISTYNQ